MTKLSTTGTHSNIVETNIWNRHEKAEGDYHTARRELRARKHPNYNSARFQAQQCVEKWENLAKVSRWNWDRSNLRKIRQTSKVTSILNEDTMRYEQ